MLLRATEGKTLESSGVKPTTIIVVRESSGPLPGLRKRRLC